ncbi:hypothetical protein ACFOWE_17975 [Planomonospora corallina]|uniref:Uncharacterized protein n=1 Tax=Planomonospora corallina TaxID=1806052 RepID=A0ABV8I9Z0_9ACTN
MAGSAQRITVTRRVYLVSCMGHLWQWPVDPISNARVAALLCGIRAGVVDARVEVFTRTETATACSWCRARPRAWERDYDGLVELVECGAPQCRAARRAACEGLIAPPPHVTARVAAWAPATA